MYPIKYIENNLVFNRNGECYAYYEFAPYNYSFLSLEQKAQIHDQFRQLIAQNRNGNIHALEIATEESIRSIQEKSKKCISGNLADVAEKYVDAQTEYMVETIGENQIDYRFFIGFKLLLNEQDITLQNIKHSLNDFFKDFIAEVNTKVMGDYITMNNELVNRYSKMERLLYDRIRRRFKMRPVTENDIGYIIEHISGQNGTAYEDYEIYIPRKKGKRDTLVKRFDIIKPYRSLLEEKKRHLEITSESSNLCVSYLTIETIVGEIEFPSSEIFYYQQGKFDFPIDTSMNIEIVTNKKALTTVRNKKKELKDLDNHAFSSNQETTGNVIEAIEDVDELEMNLDESKESLYKLSYVVRVSANNKEELERRVEAVKDFYDDSNIKLVRPFGDMIGLHKEFIPSSKRYMNDYIQYVTSDFIASLGFGATQLLGERYGIYIGYNEDTGRNVYLQPHLAAQGIKGTITNALAGAFLGSLGGGKSFCNNLLVMYAVLFGAQAVILDPKSERGNWKTDFPEMADEIQILNFTSDKENRGLLDPFIIMPNVEDAKSLAKDILMFLTGITIQEGEKFAPLNQAISEVAKSDKKGLLNVISELNKIGTPIAEQIASHISSFTDYDFAQLLFSDGTVEKTISLDKQINIFQISDLVLPDSENNLTEYTALEMLSVAMMLAISTFSLSFIHSDRSKFKIVDIDEAWSFLQVAQGKTLSNKLVRAGRSMNSAVYFVTQNCDDLLDEKMKNNIGMKFAFRSNDTEEIRKTLTFFGLDSEDENNHRRIMNLENGQCLFQDIYGYVGILNIDPIFEEFLKGFDTRPPQEIRE